ncbi:MAG: carbohydrate ABC transporter substrate-binding protein [Acholeplasmatales bacterium]|nr:carbohydrate ABC transporter substrate-binding protein [Acholeplasmatales bacterium]
MKKKVLKGAAVAALGGLVALSLASCGSSDSYKAEVSDGGKVLNIRVWNEEFISRFKDYYPGAKEVKANEEFTLTDGTTVKFQMTANKDNAYQNALDIALKNQSKAAADDKVDMFLFEADYALKYVNSNYSLDVKDLGMTDSDTADMYQYTKDIATVNNRLKGVSWQATPGLFAYRTDIAEAVLGTSDPVEVQKQLADWTKFDETAAKMKAKGYAMLSGYDDAYRVFSNNIKSPLVNSDKKIVIDENLKTWIKQTKDYTDKGYNNKTTLWDDNWNKQQTINGNTFGFFYSTWGINFTLAGNAEIKNDKGENLVGKYRVCEGPASYYWGGTWMAAANGTDNKSQVLDIMKKLTCDATIAEKITRDTLDYTNNKTAMNKIANDATYGSEFLGGQNHIKLFAAAAPKIDMKNISAYDQGINEKLQEAMKDYFAGTVTEEKAWENFYTKVTTVYPELKK